MLGTGAIALIGVGSRINANFDNDRVFQTTTPAAASGEAPTTQGSSSRQDSEPTVIHVKSGDTAWELADEMTDGDPRPLVDKITEASGEDGKPGLQAGETITLED